MHGYDLSTGPNRESIPEARLLFAELTYRCTSLSQTYSGDSSLVARLSTHSGQLFRNRGYYLQGKLSKIVW